MEFETIRILSSIEVKASVNLLRWSLKPFKRFLCDFGALCKFTPMEFETGLHYARLQSLLRCKFTPMEFETIAIPISTALSLSVNLLRWSLKQTDTA